MKCWHKWGKWERIKVQVEMLTGEKYIADKQQRECGRCGLTHRKAV